MISREETADRSGYLSGGLRDQFGDQLPDGNFMYERTGISEVAPRPQRLTLDLLRSAYTDGGPVMRAYREFGVSYADLGLLKVVGNQLYVDREAELRSLLPAYGRLNRADYSPGIVRLGGLLRTVRNLSVLSRLHVPDPAGLVERLRPLLVPPKAGLTFETALEDFLSSYQTVFVVNLLAERALADLSALATELGASLPALLSGEAGEASELRPPAGLIGNGFDLLDRSEFDWLPVAVSVDACMAELERAPADRKDRLELTARTARAYVRLRECGRWLTVRLATQLRAAAGERSAGWSRPEDIFSATVDELLGGREDESACRARRERWERWNRLSLPVRLVGRPTAESLEFRPAAGLAPGRASGALRGRDGLDRRDESRPVVLWVEELTPDLVSLFGQVVGIVAGRGSLLSHSAIVARERGLPVVVDPHGADCLGREVTIDGTAGTVEARTA
ncbi:MAG: PEP-utilizing enzyme [bacterium]